MLHTITLLTDFGLHDPYVGIMKGVIAGIAPHVSVIDLMHDIPPFDISSAAFQLYVSYSFFPAGTIFCCVVDPGVGSARRPIAIETGSYMVVCPDNGIATGLMQADAPQRVILLDDPAWHGGSSTTFHGRDIFAPVAAHLAMGIPFDRLGTAIEPADILHTPWPEAHKKEDALEGCILHIDRFGNLITNIPASWIKEMSDMRVRVGNITLHGLCTTYASVAPGEPIAYIGSSGFLELAIREKNAAEYLGVALYDPVTAEIR